MRWLARLVAALLLVFAAGLLLCQEWPKRVLRLATIDGLVVDHAASSLSSLLSLSFASSSTPPPPPPPLPASSAASWDRLLSYAQVQAGQPPRRSPKGEQNYDAYKEWLRTNGMTNPQYVLAYVQWIAAATGGSGGDGDNSGDAAPAAAGKDYALEPSLAPYELVDEIDHFLLWLHPEGRFVKAADSKDRPLLPLLPAAKMSSSSSSSSAPNSNTAAALLDDEFVFSELIRRRYLPELRREDVIFYENVPSDRSLPEIRHLHCFVRQQSDTAGGRAVASRIQEMQEQWEARSPFLQSAGEEADAADLGEL